LLLEVDGRKVGDYDGRTRRAITFWDDDPHHEWVNAARFDGGGARRLRVTFYKVKTAFDALGDLDAIAFVPASG
jgi:hypothetical protein